MWQIIEANIHLQKTGLPDPLDPVDEMLFGSRIEDMKPHPAIQQAFGPLFSQLERIDKELEDILISML